MKFLSSKKNLVLAWQRIRTAQNIGYKRFYRPIFDGIDVALDTHLDNLRRGLRVQTYQPQLAQRVLAAKPSGLQRPFTFLDPLDQIVFQSIVNVAASRMEGKRRFFGLRSVCSNRVSKSDSIHFFESWKKSYALFRRRIQEKLDSGYVYAADFDLASFYDTVSHSRLAKTVFSRQRDISDLLKKCLKTWSPNGVDHGLPQGPAPSDYLAECYLSIIDSELIRLRIVYLRYVDDIVVFGKTPADVQAGVLKLEALCRENGLIPQAGKFKAGRKIKSALELVKSASSYAYGQSSGGAILSEAETIRSYTGAVSRRTRLIADSTQVKRALFRGKPTNRLLHRVLNDIEKNPALIEAFSTYLQRFGYRRKISRFMQHLILSGSPYHFVQGEYWIILILSSKTIDPKMVALARRSLSTTDLPATLRISLYAVLIKDAGYASACVLIRALRKEKVDWVRAWAISHFRRILKFPEAQRFAASMLRQETLAASSASKLYAESAVFPPKFQLPQKLSRISEGGLRSLGIVGHSPRRPPDDVSALLASGFRVSHWNKWKELLGERYDQARICLQLGLRGFEGNPSEWMGNIDSFNDIAVRCLMDLVRRKLNPGNLPKAKIKDRQKLTDYGFFLLPGYWFHITHQSVCQDLHDFHKRRNRLTSSHPFDSFTAEPSKPLKHSERDRFVRRMRGAYEGLQRIATSLLQR